MVGRFLTPTDGTGDDVILDRVLSLPVFCWPYVFGVLQQLTESKNWEQYGNLTPDEVSQIFFNALDGFE